MTDSLTAPATFSYTAAPVRPKPLNLLSLWLSTITVFLQPAYASSRWTLASLRSAFLVALPNLLLIPAWLYLIIGAYLSLETTSLRKGFGGPWVEEPFTAYLNTLSTIPLHLSKLARDVEAPPNPVLLLAGALTVLSVLVISFFILLPFAARPGPTRPAIKHTVRTVLLTSGYIHLWALAILATFFFLIASKTPPGFENFIPKLFLTFSFLFAWTLFTSVTAVRADYRSTADLPKPKDPTCEFCGYDLRMAPPDSRCSECGRPVADSLAPHTRPLSSWESNPSPLNLKGIARQALSLITSPRPLFYSMPTRTAQHAAHRWLLGSMLLVAALAFLIVPGFVLIGIVEWSPNVLAGGLAMAAIWTSLALMMVGIETLGLVTYGRFHNRPIELAAAAKTTSYSAFLMFFWVLLGGLQLLALAAWYQYGFARHTALAYSPRISETLSVGSFALAHIAGLLWYEITVYRGARAIQWANK